MVRAAGELQGSTPIYENDNLNEKPTITRRGFVVGGAVVAGLAGMGLKLAMNGENNSSGERYTSSDYKEMSVDERVEAISHLKIKNLQKNLPDADPRKFIGKTEDQIRDGAPIPITPETSTDQGFAEFFMHKRMAEAANYGWSLENLVDAAKQKYPIGEGDPQVYREYLNKFIKSRLSGLFEYEYRTNGVNHTDVLADYFMFFSQNFEYVIQNGGLANTTGPQFFINEVTSLPVPSAEFDRSLSINYTLESPLITNVLRLDGPEGGYSDAIYESTIILDINESIDEDYIIGLRSMQTKGTDKPLGS